jgi:hypothetical protein
MLLSNVPMSALLAVGASTLAALVVCVLIWRRSDPLLLKIGVTLITFVPVVGPLFALWVLSFPDRMHPALQAKYPRVVNTYSSPHVPLPKPRARWHAVWRRLPHRDAQSRKSGDAA